MQWTTKVGLKFNVYCKVWFLICKRNDILNNCVVEERALNFCVVFWEEVLNEKCGFLEKSSD